MRTAVRFMIGAMAMFNLALGLGFLIHPAQAGLRFFLTPLGTQGLATLRTDFPAFFLTGGVFALIAAWRAQRAALLPPLCLLCCALAGRTFSLVVDGAPGAAFAPWLVEALMIAILALGWRAFDNEGVR